MTETIAQRVGIDGDFDTAFGVLAACVDAEFKSVDFFSEFCTYMQAWHACDMYPTNTYVVGKLLAIGRWSKGSCNVYASNLLKWARSGKTPESIGKMIQTHPEGHVKDSRGRKAGQGAGKSASHGTLDTSKDPSLTAPTTLTTPVTPSPSDAPKTLEDVLNTVRSLRVGLTKITSNMEVLSAWEELIAVMKNVVQAERAEKKLPEDATM